MDGKIATKHRESKWITGKMARNHGHLLRANHDAIMVGINTIISDDPKLNCRLKGMKKFSPKRIILDNKLNMNNNSYIFKTANKNNTIIFYNEAVKSKILEFNKKKIVLIKSKLNKNKTFDILLILKKLYNLGCRNILIEGGNELTKNFLNKKVFNQFYLFKSSIKLSKLTEFKEFNGLRMLKKNYKKKSKVNSNFGKDIITLYKS